MAIKAILLFANYGPYHVARWRAAAAYLAQRGVNLLPVQVAESEEIYPWDSKGATAGLPLVTLFPGRSYQRIPPWRAVRAMCRYLKKADIAWAAIPGYARWEFLAALLYLKGRGKLAIMMSDSKYDDFPRRPAREWAKGWVVRLFDGAVVSGTKAGAYLAGLGMDPGRIFQGYDVVNNEHFSEASFRMRAEAKAFREKYGLPPKYFLSVGRFVPKKNMALLLLAFARYRRQMGTSGWHLVLCGAGPLEDELKALGQDLGVTDAVHFAGFRQNNDLPAFYSLAQAFILASSQGEQWGLVVNEAMASGLPVLVSDACGCACDLVQEGVNGFTFNPENEEGLTRLMLELSSGRWNLQEMGQASRQIINHWSPQLFAENLWAAFASCQT